MGDSSPGGELPGSFPRLRGKVRMGASRSLRREKAVGAVQFVARRDPAAPSAATESSALTHRTPSAVQSDDVGPHAPAAPVGPFQPWRYLYRLPVLLVLVVIGLPVLLVALVPGIRSVPLAGRSLGWRVQRRYARLLVRVLGMRMVIDGEPPEAPALVVANHISWFDIPLLHALAPMWLVAKHDIRDWLFIGWLARAVGTIFIARGDESSRKRASRRMTALLKRGRIVGIFPEGGIRPERGVNRFHARLFASAVRAGVPVVPVAIRYWRDGDVHDERVFGPGSTFLGLLVSMLARPACDAQLIVGQPLDSVGVSRRELALTSQARVTEMYGHAASR